jgi:predicted nucleotidyltransferase
MNVARPYTAICPGLEGEVLHVLSGTRVGLTGRQIALMTGRSSHSGVLDVLHRLADHGLVERIELNRSYLFSLNRDHLAAPAVEALSGLRESLLERIRELVGRWQIAPVHLSLFGSTSRGDGDTESDIDLFVVRPAAIGGDDANWREQLDLLEQKIPRWTGNRAAVHDVSETEIARFVAEELPVVSELREDAIALGGLELSALLGER